MSDAELEKLFPKISNALNSLSIASSLIVLIFVAIVGLYRRQMINRTTLRLQIAISLFDFLNALFALFHHTVKEEGSFCTFIALWRNFGEHMYCFLNIAIALNLQLIFLHGKSPSKKWEYFYWLVSLGVALFLALLPLGMGLYGLNGKQLCYITEELQGAKAMIFVDTSLIFILTFIYVLVIAILVNIKLVRAKGSLGGISDVSKDVEVNDKFKSYLKTMIFRISLYPIFCILGLSGFIVGYLNLTVTGERIIGISFWGMVGITTKGFFNMISFFLDPTFQEAAIMTYRDIFHKHEDGNHAKEFDHDLESNTNNIFTINYDAYGDSKSTTIDLGNEDTEIVDGNEFKKFL